MVLLLFLLVEIWFSAAASGFSFPSTSAKPGGLFGTAQAQPTVQTLQDVIQVGDQLSLFGRKKNLNFQVFPLPRYPTVRVSCSVIYKKTLRRATKNFHFLAKFRHYKLHFPTF